MKKVLLTGGNGFFCSRFIKKYKTSYEIFSTDLPEVDITDERKIMDVFTESNPDYVIHGAAIANTNFCHNNPQIAYNVNVTGTLNVARACKRVGAKMIFISTEQVFNGNLEGGPYTEENVPHPDTVYGQNKLEAERLLGEMLDELWILRFTWLFGLPERNCSMVPNILWNTISIVLEGKRTKVTSNEYRGLTYVNELIDQFSKIFNIPYGTYHIGSENNLSRYDISCLILKELGLENRIGDLLENDVEKYKNHQRDIRLCTDKIAKYGINFSYTRDAIRRCIKEFRFKV